MAGQESFSAQISGWGMQTRDRIERIFKQSSVEIIYLMQDLTPVDTGFLRASIVVNLTGPVPAVRDNPGRNADWGDSAGFSLTIAGAKLGDVIYATYGANYAKPVEYGTKNMAPRAMVRGAASQWQATVRRVSATAQMRAGNRGPASRTP